MDVFWEIRNIEGVKKVSDLSPDISLPLNLFFFLCPARKGPFKLNPEKTGFTAVYKPGITPKSAENLARARQFLAQLKQAGIPYTATAVFASADSIVCFSRPVERPALPELPELAELDIVLVENYDPFLTRFQQWVWFMKDRPWKNVPGRFLVQGRKEMDRLFLFRPPANVFEDFMIRLLAYYALDGIIAREGAFGPNPVLLGVEGEWTDVVQNSAISPRLPTIII